MFNRAWLAGGIPRTACVAAYEPICAVSLADSYINRANPGTNDAAPGTAPTWSAKLGWTFNGTTQYLTTGVVPGQMWSMIARYSNASLTPYRGLMGSRSGTPYANSLTLWLWGGTGKSDWVNGIPYVSLTAIASGVMAIAGLAAYRDGVGFGDLGYAAWPGAAPSIYIGDVNGNSQPFLGDIQAAYIYNVPITPTQVRAVTDAMNMLPMRPQLPRFRSWLATKRQIPGVNKGPFVKGN